jgi:hypothetical protein
MTLSGVEHGVGIGTKYCPPKLGGQGHRVFCDDPGGGSICEMFKSAILEIPVDGTTPALRALSPLTPGILP